MDSAKLGLWESAELAVTVRQYRGSQYYQSLPAETHFLHSVARILAIQNARDKKTLHSAPSLYILGPVPENAEVVSKREPTFSHGRVDVSGKIWFGAEAMNSCKGIPIPVGADPDALFTYVSGKLASGNRPAIYFDGAASKVTLRFYPKGVNDSDNCNDVIFCGIHINAATLRDILDRVHEKCLITPTASIAASHTLWSNGLKCHPAENAEQGVQSIIQNGLACALGNVRVKHEGTGITGRYDLALVEQDPLDPSKFTNHAVLELKVVKAFTSSGRKVSEGTNLTAVIKGVRQAFAYRKERGAHIAALCCYDMRPKPTLDQDYKRGCKIAKNLNVDFWAWPLFSTTEAYRNWLVENCSTEIS